MGLLLACQREDQQPQDFVGYWYSEYKDPTSGDQYRSIAERRADGVIALTFRRYRDGKVLKEFQEAGRWFVADGFYKVQTKVVDGLVMDPRSPDAYDTYIIVSRSPNEIVYKHELAGITFTSRRVHENFKLP